MEPAKDSRDSAGDGWQNLADGLPGNCKSAAIVVLAVKEGTIGSGFDHVFLTETGETVASSGSQRSSMDGCRDSSENENKEGGRTHFERESK